MPFQKGHKPYPRKTESVRIPTKPEASPEEIASNLTGGIALPRMKVDGGTRVARVRRDTPNPPSSISRSDRPLAETEAPLPTDMASVMGLLVKALEKIASGQEDSREAAKVALDQAQKNLKPFGAKHTAGLSAFNPQGDREYPRPRLKCKMFLPWPADEGSMTYEEIELLNLLQEGDFRVRKNDGTRITVTIRVEANYNTGAPERLLMNSERGFSNIRHRQMPPLSDILRQILSQRAETKAAAADVLTMEERLALVESGELAISTAEM